VRQQGSALSVSSDRPVGRPFKLSHRSNLHDSSSAGAQGSHSGEFMRSRRRTQLMRRAES